MSKRLRLGLRCGALICKLLVVSVLAFLPFALINEPVANALPSPCDLIPNNTAQQVCNDLGPAVPGNLNTPNIPGVPNPITSVADDIVGKIATQLTKYEADAVASTMKQEMTFINTSTTPTLTAPWFEQQYALLFGLAIPVGLIMWVLRTSLAVKNLDANEGAKGFGWLIAFICGAGFAPAVVGSLVKVVDGPLTQGWLNSAGANLQPDMTQLSNELMKTQSFGDAILLPLAFLALGFIGGLITILELVFREGAIYVFTAAWVIVLAVHISGRLSGNIFGRVTWGLVGLILLKPMMAIMLTIGLGLVSVSGQGSQPVIAGIVVCVMVPFVSWSAYKVVSKHNAQPARWVSKGVTAVKTMVAFAG